MDFDARKEIEKMTLKEAQELIVNNTQIMIGSSDPKITIALGKIARAMKNDWQLIRLSKLTEGLEDLARQGLLIIDDNKADGWMAALEQIAALIKDCIKEGVNNDN